MLEGESCVVEGEMLGILQTPEQKRVRDVSCLCIGTDGMKMQITLFDCVYPDSHLPRRDCVFVHLPAQRSAVCRGQRDRIRMVWLRLESAWGCWFAQGTTTFATSIQTHPELVFHLPYQSEAPDAGG